MRFIAVLLLAITVAACVHRIDVQQGNYVPSTPIQRHTGPIACVG